MNHSADVQKIQLQLVQIFETLGITKQDLHEKLHTRVTFDRRKGTFGRAHFSVKTNLNDETYYEANISFSTVLWPQVSEKHHLNTIIHEACHIADFFFWKEAGLRGYPSGHGSRWQTLMRKAGIEDPQRCSGLY